MHQWVMLKTIYNALIKGWDGLKTVNFRIRKNFSVFGCDCSTISTHIKNSHLCPIIEKFFLIVPSPVF